MSLAALDAHRPDLEDRYRRLLERAQGALRLLVACENRYGADALRTMYAEFGQRIHEAGRAVDRAMLSEVIAAMELDPDLIRAADDESWDEVVLESHHHGLAPVGDDVGTPIVQLRDNVGRLRGFFGPILSPVPRGDDAARLWDALSELASSPSFFELKRPHGRVPTE